MILEGTMTAMEIQIRKAQTTDGVAITELLRTLTFLSQIKAEEADATQARVLAHLALAVNDDSHLILVAESTAGEIAGYGAVHWLPYLILAGPEGYVSELFVRDDLRGQGIGSRLLDALKAEAQKRGCSRLMLLNMRQRESYQRQFYAKQGWVERPEAANFVLKLSLQANSA